MTTKAKAQRAGWIYIVFSLVAIFTEFFVPRIFGSPSRAAIFASFVTLLLHLVLLAALFDLFEDVDRYQALLMAFVVVTGVAVGIANLFSKLAAVVLVDNKPLADAFLRLSRSGSGLVIAFWGVWLFPFGILVLKSRFIPKMYGILLLVAGVGYTAVSIAAIVAPEYRPLVQRFASPLYFGELPVIFWLAFIGAREPQPLVATAASPA